MFLISEGGRQQSLTQAAPNELKLDEGRESGKSWSSASRWRRGLRRRQGRTVAMRRVPVYLLAGLNENKFGVLLVDALGKPREP